MPVPFVLQIDTASTTSPLYRQIVDGLRTALVDGAFPEGSQLPTVRELALDLGVHHNTVAEAYRVLCDEGWIDLARRRGATVCRRPAPPAGQANPRGEELFVQRVRAVVAEALTAGHSRAFVESALLRVVAGLKESSNVLSKL